MKKISISSFLLLALLFTGCYRDLGNYDYTLDSMNKITSVTFSPSIEQGTGGFLIEVQQALDENDTRRRVEVYVEQSHFDNLDNLDFYWYRDYVDENGKAVKDTVCTRGYLGFAIIPLCFLISSSLTPAITNGTSFSILNALELSI